MTEEAQYGNENQDLDSYGSDNRGYNDFSVLKIRLDTSTLIKEIDMYLRGTQERVEMVDGEPRFQQVKISKPKANETGIHSIMAWLRSTLNSQVVQGNFENFDRLDNYLYNYRMDLAEFLMNNRHNWDIDLQDFEGLIDMILIQMRPFMSRLVGDGERKSYASTIHHKESSSSVRDRPKGMRLRVPGFGG